MERLWCFAIFERTSFVVSTCSVIEQETCLNTVRIALLGFAQGCIQLYKQFMRVEHEVLQPESELKAHKQSFSRTGN